MNTSKTGALKSRTGMDMGIRQRHVNEARNRVQGKQLL